MLFVFLIAALISCLLLWILIPYLRLRLLDEPNARSSHRQATPRGGGIVFVFLGSVSSVIALIGGQAAL